MARKKSNDTPVVEDPIVAYQQAVESLMKDTGLEAMNQVSMLNDRRKIPTPLYVVNCMLGGGIPFGVVMQSYGPPKAGKSSWLYCMMGIFQKMYPNGIAIIIDNESSSEDSRLTYLGVDTSKVLRLPASSIEGGFKSLQKMLENRAKNPILKDVPVFVIWDTISKGMPQDSTTQSRMLAMDRARVIKGYLNELMADIEKVDMFLGLINQVIYKTDSYGNVKADSGGGVALKHNVHMSTFIEANEREDVYDGDLFLKRVSYMKMDKSKISPEMRGISIVIDVTEGGSIDSIASFLNYLMNQEYIPNGGGWYKFDKIHDNRLLSGPELRILMNYNKSYRYDEILNLLKSEELIVQLLHLVLINKFSSVYKLQKIVMQPYKTEIYQWIAEYLDENYVIWDYQQPELLNADIEKYKETFVGNPNHFKNPNEIADHMFYCLDCGEEYVDWRDACIECESESIIAGYQYKEFCKAIWIQSEESEESGNEETSDESGENGEVAVSENVVVEEGVSIDEQS